MQQIEAMIKLLRENARAPDDASNLDVLGLTLRMGPEYIRLSTAEDPMAYRDRSVNNIAGGKTDRRLSAILLSERSKPR